MSGRTGEWWHRAGEEVGRYQAAVVKPLVWGVLVGGTQLPLLPSGPPAPAVVATAALLAVVKPPRGWRLLDLTDGSKIRRLGFATVAVLFATSFGVVPNAFMVGAVLHLAFKALSLRPSNLVAALGSVALLLLAGGTVVDGGVLLTSGDAFTLAGAARDGVRVLLLAFLVGVAASDQRKESELAAARVTAVREERARIARELHDVVAHHVSVMTIQSEAARATLPPEGSERSAAAIGSAADAGRTAMTELRRLLDVLRDDEGGGLAPQPRIDDVARLVENVRATGTTVALLVEGDRPVEVSAGLQLTIYRIVQEALTNAIRHAPGAPIEVRISYGASAVTIEVTNAAEVRPGSASRGHGIEGMRERARLVEGSLVAGVGDDGLTWKVWARLPLCAVDA